MKPALLMLPELLLGAGAAGIILADLLGREEKRVPGALFTLLSAALLAAAYFFPATGDLYNGAYLSDGLALFTKGVIFLAALLTGLMSLDTLRTGGKYAGAYYALLASSALGLCLMVSSRELITMYVGLELATTSLFALTAFYREDDRSIEAGLKYLVLGASSSGIMLYGLSLLYGLAGSTYLGDIAAAAAATPGPALAAGAVLTLLGVCFKLSVVPMHIWTPDVYQGAPTPVAAFISTASKAAGFVFALRLFPLMLNGLAGLWVPLLSALALVTMTAGNLLAIPQTNVKRFLAYSTISQAGYLLVGFVGASASGAASVLFYLLIYAFSNMAAFAVVAACGASWGNYELKSYDGLARRQPLLALAFLAALLSLAGIPPLAGFVGKFYLFYASMEQGYVWLVLAAALNSTLSLYYYLLVLKRMYIHEPAEGQPAVAVPPATAAAVVLCLAGMLLLGLYPGPALDAAAAIGRALFPG